MYSYSCAQWQQKLIRTLRHTALNFAFQCILHQQYLRFIPFAACLPRRACGRRIQSLLQSSFYMLEETSQAEGTSSTTTLPLLLSLNISGAGECYSKMLYVLSTLHHLSVITDGPGRDFNAGPGRRQQFAILRFHLEHRVNQLTMHLDSRRCAQ